MDEHKLQIGIIGSWTNDLPDESYELAREIGREIAKHKFILLTGGSTGVMEFAMKGCKEENGITIGVIAASDYRKYIHLGKHIDIKINTGMGEDGRIPILIKSCDGVIVIGGGVGTLLEIGIAYHQGRPIIVMENSGSISNKLHLLLDNEGYLDSKKLVKIQFARTAEEAIKKLIDEIKKGEGKDSHAYGSEHCKRT